VDESGMTNKIAGCLHSVIDAAEFEHDLTPGPVLPIYFCRHPDRMSREGKVLWPCRLYSHGQCRRYQGWRQGEAVA